MSAPQAQQHRITLHGRELHFVAYEGIPANTRRGEPAVPPTWYLMSGGKRHKVMECLIGQPVEERDAALRKWAEENAVGPRHPSDDAYCKMTGKMIAGSARSSHEPSLVPRAFASARSQPFLP